MSNHSFVLSASASVVLLVAECELAGLDVVEASDGWLAPAPKYTHGGGLRFRIVGDTYEIARMPALNLPEIGHGDGHEVRLARACVRHVCVKLGIC